MSEITLSRENTCTDLLVPRGFLKEYMPSANGEYVKIYLYLLHYIQSGAPLSMSDMADTFEETEKDILRVLRYWDKKGVIKLTLEGKVVTGIKLLAPWEKKSEQAATVEVSETQTSTVSEEVSVNSSSAHIKAADEATQDKNATEISAPAAQKASPVLDEEESLGADLPRYTVTSTMVTKAGKSKKFNELLNLTQIYFKTQLNDMDYERLVGVYFQLGQSFDSCEVLVEYCAEKKGKMSRMTRLEKMACECIEEGLTDARSIRAYISRNDHYKLVKEALGVSTKVLAKSEKDFVQKWFETLGFNEDMVIDACARAVRNTETGRFEYTDKILSSWYEEKVHTLDQVKEKDSARKKTYENAARGKRTSSKSRSSTNKFNDFEQREIDFDEMEAIVFNYTD